MTAPTFVSVSAITASLTAPTITIPTHTKGDLLVLMCETSDQAVTTPGGVLTWVPMGSSPKSAAANSTRLTVFWAVGDGSTTSVVLNDSGDHTMGAVAVFNHGAGTPLIHATNSGESDGTAAAQNLPNVTTTVPDCMIISIGARGDDTSAQQFATSTWNNTPTPNYVEQLDGGSTTGDGGGLGMATRTHATAGATVSVVTTIRAVPTVFITVAIAPPTWIRRAARNLYFKR